MKTYLLTPMKLAKSAFLMLLSVYTTSLNKGRSKKLQKGFAEIEFMKQKMEYIHYYICDKCKLDTNEVELVLFKSI